MFNSRLDQISITPKRLVLWTLSRRWLAIQDYNIFYFSFLFLFFLLLIILFIYLLTHHLNFWMNEPIKDDWWDPHCWFITGWAPPLKNCEICTIWCNKVCKRRQVLVTSSSAPTASRGRGLTFPQSHAPNKQKRNTCPHDDGVIIVTWFDVR